MAINFLNTVAVDENVLFVDTVNDRVGIGTDSPAHTLSVNGTVSSNFFRGYTYPNNSFLDFDKDDTAANNYTALASIGRIAYLADTNTNEPVANAAHEFFTGTSDIDTATSLMVINTNGNVGIGTTSPTEKLEVVGNVLITAALLSNQENTDIDSAAAEVVAQVAHATYTAAFFDFVVKKGTNVRSGTVYACHNGDTTPLVEFTETSTNDLGDTSDVTLSVDISGTNMRLLATVTSDDWSVKSLIRAI